MELKDTGNFHQSEYVETKKIVQKMMLKFYDWIMAKELAINPNSPHILIGKKESL